MPVLPRLILMLGVALYHPASALAQSSTETMPEALRRLFESIPAHDFLFAGIRQSGRDRNGRRRDRSGSP